MRDGVGLGVGLVEDEMDSDVDGDAEWEDRVLDAEPMLSDVVGDALLEGEVLRDGESDVVGVLAERLADVMTVSVTGRFTDFDQERVFKLLEGECELVCAILSLHDSGAAVIVNI